MLLFLHAKFRYITLVDVQQLQIATSVDSAADMKAFLEVPDVTATYICGINPISEIVCFFEQTKR